MLFGSATGKKHENSSQYSMISPASSSRASHSQTSSHLWNEALRSLFLDVQGQTSIPSLSFGLVHDFVGMADEFLLTTSVHGISGAAKAGRDYGSNPSADRNTMTFQGSTQSLCHDKRLLRVSLRQGHNELVSPKAEDLIALPKPAPKEDRHQSKDLTPVEVPIAIVDFF